jgi:hypothetical protein
MSVVSRSLPTISDLPPPPPDRVGWPWTVATPPAAPTLPDGRQWPRITIVTPSYQQAAYLEEAIRSVLLQGYPNLEYIVMDGGSRDGSVEIIQRYAHGSATGSHNPTAGNQQPWPTALLVQPVKSWPGSIQTTGYSPVHYSASVVSSPVGPGWPSRMVM